LQVFERKGCTESRGLLCGKATRTCTISASISPHETGAPALGSDGHSTPVYPLGMVLLLVIGLTSYALEERRHVLKY
jgi:hypothetical protein